MTMTEAEKKLNLARMRAATQAALAEQPDELSEDEFREERFAAPIGVDDEGKLFPVEKDKSSH